MKAAQWIDHIKEAKGWASDYRVAKELGLSRTTISQYRARTPTVDEETAVKIATVLQIDPIMVLVDQALEKSKSPEARTAWTVALDKFGWTPQALAVVVTGENAINTKDNCILC